MLKHQGEVSLRKYGMLRQVGRKAPLLGSFVGFLVNLHAMARKIVQEFTVKNVPDEGA